MITALELENFKSFRRNVAVNFSPINLIYGENSAGKSSLIQALLLLKQSWQLARTSTEDELLEFRGHYIDLGGYGATVSDHDYIDKDLTLGFSVGGRRRHFGARNPFNSGNLSLQFVFGSDGSRKPHIRKVAFSRGREQLAEFSLTKKGNTSALFLADAESARNVVALWLQSEEELASHGSRRIRERREFADDDIKWVQGWLRKTPCNLIGLLPAWSPEELRGGRPGRPIGGSLDSPKRRTLQEFVFAWQYWMSNLFATVSREFDAVKYVGPLRRAPQRLIIESSETSRELGPRGEQALRVLAAEPKLIEDLNTSLELLEVPYELGIRELATEKDTVDVGDISVLSLADRRNGTKVTLGDVGVGVSQILPVLMQLLLHRNSTILIEQPELHLHPRLQSRLADILVQSATERRNTLLIETHSEHILIRLQRRMRDRVISPKQVQVLYVGNESGDSEMWSIDLTHQGEMVGGWPGGFFDDRLSDLLGDQ